MLLVDVGNLYSLKRGDEQMDEARFILQQMGDQGYDAIAMGAKDLALPDSCKQLLLDEAPGTWIGTNLKPEDRGSVIQPHLIQKVDGVKVGLFSWIDPAYNFNRVDSAKVLDNLVETARELRPKVDVLVLLAHTSNRGVEDVMESVPEVDFVLLGGNASPMMKEKLAGQTLIGNAGDRGRHVAWFDIELDRNKQMVKREYGVMKLDHDFPRRPDVAQAMLEFSDMLTEKKADKIEKERLAKLDRLGINPFSLPGHDSPLSYVGDNECRACHTDVYSAYKATPHARAFSNLIRERESNNEEKLPKYTTGYLEKTGFLNRIHTPRLMNVQCESCHGRGSEHVRTEGKALETLRPDPENSCVACHTQDFDPDFDLEEGLKHVHNMADIRLDGAASRTSSSPLQKHLPKDVRSGKGK